MGQEILLATRPIYHTLSLSKHNNHFRQAHQLAGKLSKLVPGHQDSIPSQQ